MEDGNSRLRLNMADTDSRGATGSTLASCTVSASSMIRASQWSTKAGAVSLRFKIRWVWRAEIGPYSRPHALDHVRRGSEALGSLPMPQNEAQTRKQGFERCLPNTNLLRHPGRRPSAEHSRVLGGPAVAAAWHWPCVGNLPATRDESENRPTHFRHSPAGSSAARIADEGRLLGFSTETSRKKLASSRTARECSQMGLARE